MVRYIWRRIAVMPQLFGRQSLPAASSRRGTAEVALRCMSLFMPASAK